MKVKTVSVLLLLAAVLIAFYPAPALAADEDFTYFVSNGQATITGYTGPGGNVTVPDSLGGYPVIEIGSQAFGQYNGVTSVTISEGIQRIDEIAFYNCISLQNVSIPASVREMGDVPFMLCTNLRSFNVSTANEYFRSLDGVLYNKATTEIITYPLARAGTSYQIPNGVSSIADEAFRGTQLNTIIMPDGVSKIGNLAFCESWITIIDIPDSVSTIGYYAFAYCNNITGSVEIPRNVVSIGYRAFVHCPNLTAFIVSPFNQYYSSQDGTLFNKSKTELIVCPSNNTLTSYSVPSSVTSIADCAFHGARHLTSVTIPSSVMSIGLNAFQWCFGLKEINVAASNPNYSSQGGILFNKDMTVIIRYPEDRAGDSYSIPNSVTEIEQYAFNTCLNLANITIPSSITEVNAFAFDSCHRLSNISIPNSVTTIRPYAFQHCNELQAISIPASVTQIHSSAFEGCPNLKRVFFFGDAPAISSNVFYQCNSGLTFYHTSDAEGFTNPWQGYPTAIAPRINVIASPATYGTVTGGGMHPSGSTITLAATPEPGYRFERWEGTGSTSAKYTFVASEDRTITAQFAPIDTPSLTAASAGYNKVILNWTEVERASGYEVCRSTTKSGTYTKVYTADSSTLSYSNTGLTTNKTYYYKVRAYCTARTATTYGSFSGSVSSAPTVITPAAPTLSAVPASYNSIRLSWNAVDAANGYQLYRSTTKNGTYSLIATTASTAFTHTGLTTGKTYYYKVRAFANTSTSRVYSGFSATQSAVPAAIPPAAPALTVASASYNSNRLSWNAVSGANGYQIYRSTTKYGTYSLIATTASTAFTHTGLTTGKTYYYKLRSFTNAGTTRVYSGYSATQSAAPVPSAPASAASRVYSSSSIRSSWGAVAGASGYEVWRSDNGAAFVSTKSMTRTYYINTGLSAGHVYQYRVRAYTLVNGVRVYGGFATAAAVTMP